MAILTLKSVPSPFESHVHPIESLSTHLVRPNHVFRVILPAEELISFIFKIFNTARDDSDSFDDAHESSLIPRAVMNPAQPFSLVAQQAAGAESNINMRDSHGFQACCYLHTRGEVDSPCEVTHQFVPDYGSAQAGERFCFGQCKSTSR